MKEIRAPKQLWYSLGAFVGTMAVVFGFMGLGTLQYEMVRNHSDLKWYLLESRSSLYS